MLPRIERPPISTLQKITNFIRWVRTQRRRHRNNRNTTADYLYKSLKWFFFNSVFGLFPLILMGTVSKLTAGQEGQTTVDHLIYEGGVILFVIIAIMGAVAVDYLLAGFKFSSKEIFFYFIFPSILAGFISLEFLLVCMQKLDKFALALHGRKTMTLILLSFVYCTLVKASFYQKEDAL